jgi:RNA recognition motif-containing protein
MSKKLFIGNCDFNLDESTLESFIGSQGVEVSSVQIIRDRETGRSRGFGFAELADSSNIEDAIEALNGKEVEGRALTVNEAREKTRGGGGGGGNRNSFSSNRW